MQTLCFLFLIRLVLKYHLIRYSSGEKELYNLEKDPNEWVNLAKDTAYQTIIDKLMIEMPDSFAKDAPTKNQFIFDPLNYTFTRKVDNKIFHGFFNKPDFSWIKDSN